MLPDFSSAGLQGNVVILLNLRHTLLRISSPSSDWPNAVIVLNEVFRFALKEFLVCNLSLKLF